MNKDAKILKSQLNPIICKKNTTSQMGEGLSRNMRLVYQSKIDQCNLPY